MSTQTRPEVLCIGFGALGTIYSYLLSRGGASITAVARSNYTTLTTTGIRISSAKYGEIPGWKPDRVIRESEPESAQDRVYDFVVCAFKNVPDYKSASSIIRPFLSRGAAGGGGGEGGKSPTIVLLQNGVGIEEEVQRNLVEGKGEGGEKLAGAVISAVAWIGANLVEGGTKVSHGALERLEMGVYPSTISSLLPSGLRQVSPYQQAALDTFTSIYTSGGGGGSAVGDIEAVRWKKVLWNASWGALSTLARLPVCDLLTEDTLHYSVGVVRRIMLEIIYVGRACGMTEERFPISSVDQALNITLATSDVDGLKDEKNGGRLAADFKPSILLDLQNGRPMELEVIIGTIVRLAREKGVDTPRLDLVLGALKPNQVQAIRTARQKDGGKGEAEVEGVTKYSDLVATSRGNWPAGAPVSSSPSTYL
ncbi:hypothetical protein NDA11_005415 [Ustilago hordei]|uniref:2-dehydropantoate 2-reductase n=1 Tax=Ustilago hordei TaxID=120017 RepID=I2G4B7_USTHO|nr:uncharacterized protein UHO2_01148 [Ustilago hordei]KAJ1043374.1 hypothetical protein NDA10_006395 [Ustilago hordei]KAJ1583786.1 hypothetical protein NDA15_006754 [Ustilago hordei]KAJ1584705.1 hypothetical protein NDA11_005415 [Ustilago hordei]KAJ1592045.1 hypothetical protein NDA12_005107 [Ustilago hordei]KAJ1602730.1 hypothetical protein NDA14_000519 [Ustilago hordei]